MTSWRLPAGGAVDRAQPIAFEFDGRRFEGLAGDTVASALLAAGERVVGRSFKLHRPRGIVGLGWEDPGSLLQVLAPGAAPNVLATTLPLQPGLRLRSVNTWPNARFDVAGVLDWLHPLLPAGFYYKTFMAPQRAWMFYEHWIRRAAGLGRLPETPGTVEVQRRFAHADVLVVGAGPAGTAAALALARSGRRLVWVDDGDAPGGALRARCAATVALPAGAGDGPADPNDNAAVLAWMEAATREIDACPNVRRLPRTLAQARQDHGFVVCWERRADGLERLWKLRVAQTVLATGAVERPLVFPDNDRPGVMLASAVRGYLHRYGVAAARRLVVCGSDDDALACALDAQTSGIEVTAWVDTRPQVPEALRARARQAGIELIEGAAVLGVDGGARVRGLRIAAGAHGRTRLLQADGVAMAGGWSPALHLLAQPGETLRWSPAHEAFVPGMLPAGVQVAGSAAGPSDTATALVQGRAAAREALRVLQAAQIPGLAARPEASSTGFGAEGPRPLEGAAAAAAPAEAPAAAGPEPTPPALRLPARLQHRAFVDWGHDVTVGDIALAHREGYVSVEHLKRYTTLGMAVDQGKTSNVNGLRLMAALRGLPPDSVGTTRFRPPFVPMPFGTIAAEDGGDLVRPVRETPITPWHLAQGAVMYESGANWRRPGYYPRPGETLAQAAQREARAVREAAGLYDSTPLGKFELSGPGAGALLEAVCANGVTDLAEGRGRYALLLREDARLFDDGVVFRLGPQRFWLTSTAGNAEAVHAWLEQARQAHLQRADVIVTAVGAQWATLVVCGPCAREVLQRAGCAIDLAPTAFPFMALREGAVAGVAARVFRVSFTGELSYEINVPASRGLEVWQALWQAGQAVGLQAVGSEANHVLRVEKGFLSMAHEADGIATPDDLGLAWAVRIGKPFFFGQAALRRLRERAATDGPRPELVGLRPLDGGGPFEEGAQLLAHPPGADADRVVGRPGPMDPDLARRPQGFVTASVHSPACGHAVALALLDGGRARHGERVQVTAQTQAKGPGGLRLRPAEVCAPVFFDPRGERLRG
jgi:sarcosine oxidase subunit alpha